MQAFDAPLKLQKELQMPLLVAAISFAFWIFSGIVAIQFVLFFFVGVLVLKNPKNCFLFLLANESFIGSAPPVIAGISLTQIISGICIIGFLVLKRPLPSFSNKITILAVSIFVTFSISYWNFFQVIDLTIINNLVFFWLLLWGFDFKDPAAIRQVGFILLLTNLLMVGISLAYFIMDPEVFQRGPFGNPRQVGFFGILAIPFLYIISNSVKNTKKVYFTILLAISLIIFYNFATGSRLNIFVLIIFILFLCSSLFNFLVLPRKLVYAGMLLVLLFFYSQDFIDTYVSRGLVKVGSITDINNLNEDEMGAFSSGRSVIYKYGLEMYRDHPLFGGGYKSWSHISNTYNPFISSKGNERWSMHSTHLQYLAETGIIGLSLYWFFLGIIVVRSWRAIKLARNYPNSPMFMCGCIGFFVGLAMILGGMFDNHSIIYRQLFFAAAAVVSLSTTQFAARR